MLDGRESMSEEIIEGIRLIKESISLHGGITNFPIALRLVTLVENSFKCYEKYLEEEKARPVLEATKKSVDNETTTKLLQTTAIEQQRGVTAINIQIAEEEQKIKASDQLLADGKSIFEKSIASTKLNKDDIIRANALMSMAIENKKISNEKLDELTNKKKEI